MKMLLVRYRALILYLIFGGLTTLVNMVVFYLLFTVWHSAYQFAYIMAWFWSVLFAYLTNRVWVFGSQVHGFKGLAYEVWQFYLARVLTGILGFAILAFGVRLLHQEANTWNLIQNVFVVISNFVLGRLYVFKKRS